MDFLRYWALLAFVLHRRGSAAYGKGFDGTQVEELTKGLSADAHPPGRDRVPGSLLRLRRLARKPDADVRGTATTCFSVTGHRLPGAPDRPPRPDVEFRTHLVRLLQFASMTPVQNVSGDPRPCRCRSGRSADGRARSGCTSPHRSATSAGCWRSPSSWRQAAPWPMRTRPMRRPTDHGVRRRSGQALSRAYPTANDVATPTQIR